MPARLEYVAALVLERVESSLRSVRAVLEEVKVEAPRSALTALVLGVLRNYRLLRAALRYCGFRGRLMGSRRGWLPLVIAYEAIFRRNTVGLVKLAELDHVVGISVLECLYNLEVSEVVSQYEPRRRLAVMYSVPDWVVEALARVEPPGGVEEVLKGFQQPTPMWIRYNRARLTREQALKLLEEYGVKAKPDSTLDDVVEVVEAKPGAVARLDPRLFYVQDRSAALVAHVLGEPPGTLIDFFSAPGGKASHAAWRYKLHTIVSVEVSTERAMVEKKLCSSMGVWQQTLVVADACKPPLRRVRRAASGIVDPDCSSIGRIGHSPETRLFLEKAGPSIVYRLARLQYRGLRELALLLPKGSVLVYSTCTLTLEENEGVVKRLVEEGLVELEEASPWIGVKGRLPGTQRLYPHTSRCTGGFVARLRVV